MNLNLPILKGSQAAYDAIPIKDDATIYITQDTKRLYLGDILILENYTPEKTIKGVAYDTDEQAFTFVYSDDTTTVIDLVLESVIKDVHYDSGTRILKFTLVNGNETNIDLTDLIDVYTVKNTDTVSMSMTGGEISADVKISGDADNAIEARDNGLYVAPVKKPVALDNIVTGSGTDIKDSGKKIISAITDSTNDTDVPDVGAIRGALVIGSF